jgi:predicted nucleic acid-binding protein
MIAVDSGLLALAVNRYAPEHARAASLLESLAEGDAPWALPWSAVHEFLGFVTHPHTVARVLGANEAWGFIATLATSPSLRFLGPTPRHAEACAEVLALRDPSVAAALDASFATAVLLREHGVRELLSTDPGMRRWRFLDVRDPFRGEPWTPLARPARRYRTLTRRKPRGPIPS